MVSGLRWRRVAGARVGSGDTGTGAWDLEAERRIPRSAGASDMAPVVLCATRMSTPPSPRRAPSALVLSISLVASIASAACDGAGVGGGRRRPIDGREGDAGAGAVDDASAPIAPRADAGPPIDAGLASCAEVTAEAETVTRPVDIVWVVDSSGSMGNEAARVQAGMNAFAAELDASGVDVRVVVITAEGFVVVPAPLGTDPARYRFVGRSVSSSAALVRLVSEAPRYADFLRPDAALHFIAVTDDESAISATDFDAQIRAALPTGASGVADYVFHAIASEDVGGRPCAGAADVGRSYLALAGMRGGEFLSICTDDWTTVFGRLRDAAASSIAVPCTFRLPSPPDGETLDAERVNVDVVAPDGSRRTIARASSEGACAGAEAWFYDDPSAPAEIRLCPALCESVSSDPAVRVEIALGCDPVLL